MKDIKGFEGLYAITKYGKVWSYPRIIIKKNPWGEISNVFWKGGWIKSHTNKKGNWYMSIALQKQGKKNKKGFKIHRLIAEAFIPNPKNLPEINHKNGDKTDNRIKNLEWCSHQENITHGFKIYPAWKRKIQRGEKSWCHKLTEEKVKEIKRLLLLRKSPKSHDISCHKLAKQFGVSSPTIQGIIKGIYWKHII